MESILNLRMASQLPLKKIVLLFTAKERYPLWRAGIQDSTQVSSLATSWNLLPCNIFTINILIFRDKLFLKDFSSVLIEPAMGIESPFTSGTISNLSIAVMSPLMAWKLSALKSSKLEADMFFVLIWYRPTIEPIAFWTKRVKKSFS